MAEKKGRERRRFARYRRHADIRLKTGDRIFSARLFEFSPVGAKISCEVPVDFIDVEIIREDEKKKGRVVWQRGKFAGIEFSGPCSGKLEDYALADLLVGLKVSGNTGVLHLSFRQIRKRIFIAGGNAVFATSNLDFENLGAVLVRAGRISKDAYSEAQGLVNREGGDFGNVLIRLGHIKESELHSCMTLQAEEIIENSFRLTEGTFEFEEGPPPRADKTILSLSIAALILRGIKRLDDMKYLLRVMPGHEAVLVPSSDPFNLFQDLSPDDNDKTILSLIDGRNTIRDILRYSNFDSLETLRILHALLSTRIVDVMSEEDNDVSDLADAIDAKDIDQEVLRDVKGFYENCERMDNYEILGVDRDASAQDIRRAYHERVKKYHPDRYFKINQKEFKGMLATIFSRVNEAYNVLSRTHQTKQTVEVVREQVKSNAQLAGERFEEAMKQFRSGNFDAAFQGFGQAVYLDASRSKYHFYYGVTLKKAKKYKDAEREMLQALKLSPENGDYLAELGHLYMALNLKLRARRTFEKALGIDPDNRLASEGIAELNAQQQG